MSAPDRASCFWFDGALHDQSVAPVDLTDRGLTLGDGLFETLLVRNGRGFLREAHLGRLKAGAEVLAIPFDAAAASRALDGLAEAIGEGSLRLTLTRGGGARGLALPKETKPFLFGAAFAAAPPAFPVITVATTMIRRNETSPAARLKALPYLDAILALREAKAKGADDALFENNADRVACLSAANLFAVFGKRLVTPPLADGVLAGTIRALILARAKELGFAAEESSLTLDALLRADAVFATNSLRLLSPCRTIDTTPVASIENGCVKALRGLLAEAVDKDCRGA